MQALFFGSIGSVIETSELQRGAFNAAFAEHGLDWHWDQETYRTMLAPSGGKARIRQYAITKGDSVNAEAIHATKSDIFAKTLAIQAPAPRPGVIESLNVAREMGLKTAFVTTTLPETINTVLDAHAGALRGLFDTVTSTENVFRQKPAPEAYMRTCAALDVDPALTLAVEDNQAGITAAYKAGCEVIAFLGANTQHHDASHAHHQAGEDIFASVLGALSVQDRDAS
ncbi:MAG: HAD-IA family hydrolase [Pseudomonadota bacterium]